MGWAKSEYWGMAKFYVGDRPRLFRVRRASPNAPVFKKENCFWPTHWILTEDFKEHIGERPKQKRAYLGRRSPPLPFDEPHGSDDDFAGRTTLEERLARNRPRPECMRLPMLRVDVQERVFSRVGMSLNLDFELRPVERVPLGLRLEIDIVRIARLNMVDLGLNLNAEAERQTKFYLATLEVDFDVITRSRFLTAEQMGPLVLDVSAKGSQRVDFDALVLEMESRRSGYLEFDPLELDLTADNRVGYSDTNLVLDFPSPGDGGIGRIRLGLSEMRLDCESTYSVSSAMVDTGLVLEVEGESMFRNLYFEALYLEDIGVYKLDPVTHEPILF